MGQYFFSEGTNSKHFENDFSLNNKPKKDLKIPLNNDSNFNLINEHQNDISILSDDNTNKYNKKDVTKKKFNTSSKKENNKLIFSQIINKNDNKKIIERNDNNLNVNKYGKNNTITNKTSTIFFKMDNNNLSNNKYNEHLEEVNLKNKSKNIPDSSKKLKNKKLSTDNIFFKNYTKINANHENIKNNFDIDLDVNLVPEKNCFYLGEKVNGQKEGLGLEIYSKSKAKYFGYFKNDERVNIGHFKINNRDESHSYFGFVNGIHAEGFGWYQNKKKAIYYEGMWLNSKKEGIGIEINYDDKSEYKGYFKNGKKCGIGYCSWNDKSNYSGEWKNDNFDGYGIYHFQDGTIYKGHWKNNKMDGLGELIYPEFKTHFGFFKNDQSSGFGIMIWYKESKVFIGYWQDSKLHGPGKAINNGIINYGIWENGKCKEEIKSKNYFISRLKKGKYDYYNFFKLDNYNDILLIITNILNGNREEEEKKKKLEEERKRKLEEERKRKLEEERRRKEEEEKRKKEEEERIRKKLEEERKRKIEEERIRRKIEEERIRKLEKERKKREIEKNLILKNQKNFRNKIPSVSNNDDNNVKVKQTLEDMCNYGNLIKKEIEDDKKNAGNKFIYTKDLKSTNYISDPSIFALGLLAQNLESNGVEAVIEKNPNSSDEEAITNLQFILNGLNNKKKYILRFDFGENENEKILEKGEEYDGFVDKLKQKLSRDYGVNPDDIIITYPERGSVQVQIIFQSDEFNDLNTRDFENKFKNEKEFPELKNLKTIHTDVLMGACKLSKNQLDPRGNRQSGWGVNEQRGNKPYFPPLNWTGIGLKVMDKYENNLWLGMNNSPGEWCVAYHGVGSGQSSDQVKKITGNIYKGSFKAGWRQLHKECPDKYHPGKKVGEGVYCTPHPETAEQYAGFSEINGKHYKTILMVRIKPEAIRNCDQHLDSKNDNYWVINGTTDEIRPYRILYKEC